MPRRSQDLLLTVSRALPAQNTSAASASIDLGSVLPDTALESVELMIRVPATTCATGQTITLTPQDSADGSSGWATIARLAPIVLTGASNATADTGELRFRLPSNTRRFFRVNITMSATTGDQTAITATIRLDS